MKQIITITAALTLISGCASMPQPQIAGQTLAMGGQAISQPILNPVVPTTVTANSGLVNILVGQLGISPQQAMGGTGSIFSLAQQRMSPSAFS